MFRRRSETDFFRELEESVRVLKGFFLGCCLEEMSPRFKEEVGLIFL